MERRETRVLRPPVSPYAPLIIERERENSCGRNAIEKAGDTFDKKFDNFAMLLS